MRYTKVTNLQQQNANIIIDFRKQETNGCTAGIVRSQNLTRILLVSFSVIDKVSLNLIFSQL